MPDDALLALALDTLKKNKQALIFAPTRPSAEKTAEDLASSSSLFLPELSHQILQAVSSPTKQCRRLSHCIQKGIAFHHAGLAPKQKEIIEQEFRQGTIKIICCTPTLAYGVDTPAFRVIIKSLKRYSGTWGLDWIPVLEYLQMCGRAGRPGYEPFGEALTIAKNEEEKSEIYQHYICGQAEEIYSKLAVEPVFRTYLLSLIATNTINTYSALLDFFSRTFWAFQFKDADKINSLIDNNLELLEEYGFIVLPDKSSESRNSGFISAARLRRSPLPTSDFALKASLLGQRVSQLYLDPFTAHHLLTCLRNSSRQDIESTSFSFLQAISNTREMSPLLRIRSKEYEEIQEQLVQRYPQLLQPEPPVDDLRYGDFINSIKTALFFEAWINEEDEDFLLEKYNIPPGEVYTKREIADWLLYSAGELAKLLQFQPVLKELSKLRLRLRYGAKEELLPLLRLKGIGRQRARKLYNNKIKDIKALHQASLQTLSQLLGQKTAELVKQQLETPAEPVPEGKRKGQLAISKFG